MPITSIDSYPPTMTVFGLHWVQVNNALIGGGGTMLLLPGGFTLASFQALRDSIVTTLTSLEDLVNDYELGLADRDSLRENLRARVVNFRQTCQSQFPGSRYLRALPDTPQEAAAEGKILSVLDDVANLWGKINADTGIVGFTPPLVLRGNYSITGFTTDVADLRSGYNSLAAAERELKLAREDRDRLLADAYERMKQYRARVAAEFLETDPLFQSLPDLSPAPGSTPDPVTASGQWNAPSSMAQLSWTTSPAANLQHYSVRMTLGPTFDTQNNTVVQNVPPGQTALDTTAGLQNPGNVASYRVYVVLDTGNESGSNTVTITRP